MVEKKEHFFLQRLDDLANRTVRTGFPAFTDFMTTKEYMLAKQKAGQIKNAVVVCWGGHEECEHMMCGFFPLDFEEEKRESFPIECICIRTKNDKYARHLCHRDYLGAILNLGIERSIIGDIRIHEQAAFVFCKKDFASFIVDNFTMVKHTPVTCHVLSHTDCIPKQRYEEIHQSVASLRLDNVVAAMIGSARGKATALITQGHVIANHEEHTSVSYSCKKDMVFSIRGYGKYRLDVPTDSFTKKGKQKIIIYKYI